MDGSEGEVEKKNNIPRLPLFNPPAMHSPEPSGMQTPPLHNSASVPFGWEEEPGKPKPCTDLVSFSNNPRTPKCLELPPRLLIDANLTKVTKLPSPNTVLEGPYVVTNNNSYRSSSFRMSHEDCNGSFGAERSQLGTMVLSKEKGSWFGSWREKVFNAKRELSGGSHVFPSSADRDADHIGIIGGSHKKLRMAKVKRSRSSSNLFHAKSCVWTRIREGLKQVVPWRRKKLKKDGYGWA